DGGEAVDGFAVGGEGFACPFGGAVDVPVSQRHDGEGESGFAGAHGAAIGAIRTGGESEDFLRVFGGVRVVAGDAVAVHGVEVPLGGVDDEVAFRARGVLVIFE